MVVCGSLNGSSHRSAFKHCLVLGVRGVGGFREGAGEQLCWWLYIGKLDTASNAVACLVLPFNTCWVSMCTSSTAVSLGLQRALGWHQERTKAAGWVCATWHVQCQDYLSCNKIKPLCSTAIQCRLTQLLVLSPGNWKSAEQSLAWRWLSASIRNKILNAETPNGYLRVIWWYHSWDTASEIFLSQHEQEGYETWVVPFLTSVGTTRKSYLSKKDILVIVTLSIWLCSKYFVPCLGDQ